MFPQNRHAMKLLRLCNEIQTNDSNCIVHWNASVADTLVQWDKASSISGLASLNNIS